MSSHHDYVAKGNLKRRFPDVPVAEILALLFAYSGHGGSVARLLRERYTDPLLIEERWDLPAGRSSPLDSLVELKVHGINGLLMCQVAARLSWKVQQLKERLRESMGIPVSEQKLLCDVVELRNDLRLGSYISAERSSLDITFVRARQEFQMFDGMPMRSDLCKELLTIEQAKAKAMLMQNCEGFCFRGAVTEQPVEIYFKGTWKDFTRPPFAKWTSFRRESKMSLHELKAAGVVADEARAKRNGTAKDMWQAGYSASELLKEARYSIAEVHGAGCSASQLRVVGYSVADLRGAGVPGEAVLRAGYPASILRQVGHAAEDLKRASYTAVQLRGAGYAIADLKNCGFEDDEIVRAGYDGMALQQAGYSREGLEYVVPWGLLKNWPLIAHSSPPRSNRFCPDDRFPSLV